MKDLMNKYRPIVIELNNQSLSEFRGRTLFVKNNLYHGLAMIQLSMNNSKDPKENYQEYIFASARTLYNYLSIEGNGFNSKASFVYSFYQTYETFSIELILTSEFEVNSIFYDASLESSIARMFAIGIKMNSEFLTEVSSVLDSLLTQL